MELKKYYTFSAPIRRATQTHLWHLLYLMCISEYFVWRQFFLLHNEFLLVFLLVPCKVDCDVEEECSLVIIDICRTGWNLMKLIVRGEWLTLHPTRELWALCYS